VGVGSASAGSPRVFDLFEENARYFPALLPICEDGDPMAQLERAEVPRSTSSRCTNGTVYRWNGRSTRSSTAARTCGGEQGAAGRSDGVDAMANAAFYYGLVRPSQTRRGPVWSRMSFSAAEENFHSGARYGLDASLYWPGLGPVPASELVLRRLLPLAHTGLDSWRCRSRVCATACSASSEGRCTTGHEWRLVAGGRNA